ncbi:MAG: hypothetical protein RJA98_2534 [Pseudomonadota bacterium]|jgi:CRP-like cAMP-binding protein
MDYSQLIDAVRTLNAEDAFRPRLAPDQWKALEPYLTRHEIRAGDLLIKQGDVDRTMYLLGQGSVQVFVSNAAPGAARIALLRAGSVIGEPSLFGDGLRMANVEAVTTCIVWALRVQRCEELMQRSPALAMQLLRAAGAVMAIRMRANLSRQIPVV